jgi:hypothetical protein
MGISMVTVGDISAKKGIRSLIHQLYGRIFLAISLTLTVLTSIGRQVHQTGLTCRQYYRPVLLRS